MSKLEIYFVSFFAENQKINGFRIDVYCHHGSKVAIAKDVLSELAAVTTSGLTSQGKDTQCRGNIEPFCRGK